MGISRSCKELEISRNSASDCLLPRILIVDDSRDAANTLSCLFRAHGYKAQVAYDGLAGFEAAKEFLPDVILLDLGMPELDGVHLARFIREDEHLKDKVLIAITGYADETHRAQCEAAGVDHVLPKPATWESLQSAIGSLLTKRRR
ncbi:MAG: response regulator [Planctomycetes bacterium]|nr:response regulator [Planctomycetota bacterium]